MLKAMFERVTFAAFKAFVKLFVLVSFMGIIFLSIFLGWALVVGPVSFSILGAFLATRTLWQIRRSRKHLWETRAVYLPLLKAIHAKFPKDFSEEDIQIWYSKRLNAELWMRELLKTYPFLKKKKHWQAVVDETLFNQITTEQWLAAFPEEKDQQLLAQGPKNFVYKLTAAGVPVYGIEPAELEDTLRSLANQTLPFKQVAIVLNDPRKESDTPEITAKRDKIREFIQSWIAEQKRKPSNKTEWLFEDLLVANKKRAMAKAVEMVKAPIWINVDADTNATPNANFFTLLAFLMFPKLNGLTSNVRIKNVGFGKGSPIDDYEDDNQVASIAKTQTTESSESKIKQTWFEKHMLSLLTYFRYDSVNNIERAARRWNETVLSGPWLAVRQQVFLSFLDEWLEFKFAGKEVRPGDDRRITYHLNWLKLATAYFAQVIVYTDCPETMKRWRSQQSRWTLSYYVNMWDSFVTGQWNSLERWSLMDQVYGGFFSFFLLSAIGSITVQAIGLIQSGDPTGYALLAYYASMIFMVNLAKGAYAAITNRDIKGFVMTFYVYLFIRHLMPIKISRLFNLTDQRWQGRHGVT